MKTTSEMGIALSDGTMTPAEVLEGLREIRAALVSELGEEWVAATMADVTGAAELPASAGMEAVELLIEGMTMVIERSE
jgi:hypothetical protein